MLADLEHVVLTPRDVVAASLPPGSRWVDVIAQAWRAGAAVLPIDHRLPSAERASLINRARPTVVLDQASARRVEGEPADPAIVLIVHTSGSAGSAKLVQFERRAIDVAITSSAFVLGATDRDPWVCSLPVSHIGGLLIVLRGVVLGAPVIIHEAFDPETFSTGPPGAFTSLVPTMLERLLRRGTDLSGFRAILTGGAHLSPPLRERAEQAGARVVETYGLTETCGGIAYEGVPLPGTEVRLGRGGGIELRGPTIMSGYRFDARATETAFTRDSWLRTADAGRIDDRGRLHVLGRFDDVINTGGEKVWPEQVEAALRDHPGVREIAAAGRDDPVWGQHVAVWVVPADPDDPPTLADLRAFATQALPSFGAPKELTLVGQLPRTSSGKLRRHALPGTEPE